MNYQNIGKVIRWVDEGTNGLIWVKINRKFWNCSSLFSNSKVLVDFSSQKKTFWNLLLLTWTTLRPLLLGSQLRPPYQTLKVQLLQYGNSQRRHFKIYKNNSNNTTQNYLKIVDKFTFIRKTKHLFTMEHLSSRQRQTSEDPLFSVHAKPYSVLAQDVKLTRYISLWLLRQRTLFLFLIWKKEEGQTNWRHFIKWKKNFGQADSVEEYGAKDDNNFWQFFVVTEVATLTEFPVHPFAYKELLAYLTSSKFREVWLVISQLSTTRGTKFKLLVMHSFIMKVA